MPRVPATGFTRHNGRQGVWGLVMGQEGGAVRQGCARRAHGVDGFQVPVARLRVRADPHLVVVATFQHDTGEAAGVIFASWGSRACRLLPWLVSQHHVPEVAGAVLLSQSPGPLYGGMVRALALACGAAPSRPPVLGAGLGSVGGAMSVCAQPRCGTHTPPWCGWLKLNHQIHVSTRSSATCIPGLTSARSCRTEMLVAAACGRGTTGKSPIWLTSWRCPRRAATSPHGGVLAWMS